MEFIVLRTSLAYGCMVFFFDGGCMGLCCEMLNLVVLGKYYGLDLDAGFQ